MFILYGIGALLLRLGMAIHAAGMVRSKNSSSILIRSIADICLTTLAFWALGGAILFSIGRILDPHLLFSLSSAFFVICVTLVASGIVTGVASERSRFLPMCAVSILIGAVIVPLVGRWQLGWLNRLGYRRPVRRRRCRSHRSPQRQVQPRWLIQRHPRP